MTQALMRNRRSPALMAIENPKREEPGKGESRNAKLGCG
jgi:hypothetical protein